MTKAEMTAKLLAEAAELEAKAAALREQIAAMNAPLEMELTTGQIDGDGDVILTSKDGEEVAVLRNEIPQLIEWLQNQV